MDTSPRAASASPRRTPWTWVEGVLLAGLLAVAVLLRVVALDQVPPGMQHDEVFDARFATYVLNGARPVFFDENGGVFPLFSYLVAGAFMLLGRNLIALRLTAAAVGVLGLLVAYLLLRELLRPRAALLGLAGLTVSFWHLFDSRVGIEPIVAPLMAGLTFYLLWQALQRGSWLWYGLAGLSMGLTQYAHRTGPLVPLAAGAFVVVALIMGPALFQRAGWNVSRRRLLAGAGLAFLITLLVAMPLILHFVARPEESLLRVRQLSYDTRAALAGDFGPVLEDAAGVLGMFGVRGDPEWRYNVAGRPIWDPLTGLLFLAGVAVSLARRRPSHVLLLLWLLAGLAMAAVTSPSPASTRALVAIVPIYAMPAIALDAGWTWAAARGRRLAAGVAALAIFLWAGNAAWTVRDYFYVWPQNDQVRAIYRADLAAAARYLDAQRPPGAVCVSAQFAADLDQQTFDYTLRGRRLVKWFDARNTFVLPASESGLPATYLFPVTDPPSPLALEMLSATQAEPIIVQDSAGRPAVTVYRLSAEQLDQLRRSALQRPQHMLTVTLGDAVDLLGYDLPAQTQAGQPLDLVVYWRVRRGSHGEGPYAFFAHVLDERGFVWTQDDPLAYPPSSWSAGDLVLQSLRAGLPADAPPGSYHIELGFYAQRDGTRLAQIEPDGSVGPDFLALQPFEALAGSAPPAESDLSMEQQLDADFGQRLRLLGYTFKGRILNLEDRVEVDLWWQALESAPAAVELELTLIGEDGQTPATLRRQLLDGVYPLGQWRAGQIICDKFYLQHTSDIPRSIYDVRLALVDTQTRDALKLPDGATALSLGKVFMRGLTK